MVDLFYHLLSKLVNEGIHEGQFLRLYDFEININKFDLDSKPESLINIDSDKKIRYIENTYWSGEITATKPCITSITDKEIVFRSSRAFPTLYLDLKVIKSKNLGEIKLKFKKMFIGYHILAIHHLYPELTSPQYDKVLQHWQNRFKSPQKMLMLNLYQRYLKENEVI